MRPKQIKNYAFIDGQNLHLAIESPKNPNNWQIDYAKFRTYLRDKYRVERAYYFFGYRQDKHANMYNMLQEYGYIVMFKQHFASMKSQKKGNIDADLVFHAMTKLIDEPDEFNKIVIVSGDGDYKNLVDYLIGKDRFEKLLLPVFARASHLYKRDLDRKHYAYVQDLKEQIQKWGFT